MKPRPITFLGHTLDASKVLCVDPVHWHQTPGGITRLGFVVRFAGAEVTIIAESMSTPVRGPELDAIAERERERLVAMVWPTWPADITAPPDTCPVYPGPEQPPRRSPRSTS
jgi:hypothetical protein